MDDESLSSEIRSTLVSLEKQIAHSEAQFEKLMVATTTSMKLLSGQSTTLEGIGGNPKEIKSYLLRLSQSVREEVIEGLRNLEKQLRMVLKGFEDEKRNV
ncbi:hypothetical protein EU537_00985 [Candidatus Thorarchaeota archaeon]|nr:MAG: hypothetical protein EU537_00985 [Candidatus Thorarchaeota archaeon]